MTEETRRFYALEKIFCDARPVPLDEGSSSGQRKTPAAPKKVLSKR
jgi:hypothetical protein